MERIKIYGIVLLGLTPYLLMVFSPQTIEPVFSYFEKWDRKVITAIFLNAFYAFTYVQVKEEIRVSGFHPNWVPYVRLYFIIFSTISIVACFLPVGIHIFQPLYYGSAIGILAFIGWLHYRRKT